MVTADLSLTKRLRSCAEKGALPLSLALPIPKGTEISHIYARAGQASNKSQSGLLLPEAPRNQR